MLVDAVGHQQEGVAALQPQILVVDLELRVHTERAAEIALLRGQHDAMVVGQLLEAVARDAVDPAVADMEQMRGGRPDHHGAQRADIPLVFVIGVLAAPRLRVQPGIGRLQHALRRGLHRPGFRGAVIVGQEALDRGLRGNAADAARGDAVGKHHGDALQAEQRFARDQHAVEILIGVLAALIRELPDRYLQHARHRVSQSEWGSP